MSEQIRELIARLVASTPPPPPLPSERRTPRTHRVVLASGLALALVAAGVWFVHSRRSTLRVVAERGPSTVTCPGQIDPVHPDAAARRFLAGPYGDGFPAAESTTFAAVLDAISLSRNYIETHYAGVRSIGIGPGWGVAYTRDRADQPIFRHAPDYEVVVTLTSRSDCPTQDAGRYSPSGVPALFRYETKRGDVLVYSDHRSVFALNVRTLLRKRVAAGGPCSEEGIPVDAAHERIEICANVGSALHIFELDVRTGRRTDLGPQYAYLPIGWTTEGRPLLASYTSPTRVVAVQDGYRTTLVELDRSNASDVVPIADGTFAVMGGGASPELVLVKRSGVVYRSTGYLAPVIPFDDGRQLLVVGRDVSPGFRLGVLQHRHVEWTTFHGSLFVGNGSAIGPAGLIASTGEDDRGLGVFLFDPLTRSVRRIADGGEGTITWTPSGRIAYKTHDGDVWIMDVGGPSRRLFHGESAFIITSL